MAVTMWKARDIRTGREVILPNHTYKAGQDIYNAPKHRGYLQCAFCDAAVHYRAGNFVVGGGLPGPSAHFKTGAGSKHSENCAWDHDVDVNKSRAPINHSIGYRLNLNTYRAAFGVAALSHYDVDSAGRPTLIDSNLKGRKSVSITSAQNVIDFIRTAVPSRLSDTIIVGPDHDPDNPIYWNKFFLRYTVNGEQERFRRFWHDNKLKHTCPPVCMVFPMLSPENSMPRLEKKKITPWRDSSMIRGRMVVLGKDIVGTDEHVRILPRLYLENSYTSLRFPEDKSVVVLGRPKFKLLKRNVWALNFSVMSPNAFAVYDEALLMQNMMANEARRKQLSLAQG